MHQRTSPSTSSLREAPTAELIEIALRQTADLVRAEAALATSELRADAFGALVATVAMIASALLFALALALGVAAALLISGASFPTTLLGTAGVLAAAGSATAFTSTRIAPKKILVRSRERVGAEIHDIEDHAS